MLEPDSKSGDVTLNKEQALSNYDRETDGVRSRSTTHQPHEKRRNRT